MLDEQGVAPVVYAVALVSGRLGYLALLLAVFPLQVPLLQNVMMGLSKRTGALNVQFMETR